MFRILNLSRFTVCITVHTFGLNSKWSLNLNGTWFAFIICRPFIKKTQPCLCNNRAASVQNADTVRLWRHIACGCLSTLRIPAVWHWCSEKSVELPLPVRSNEPRLQTQREHGYHARCVDLAIVSAPSWCVPLDDWHQCFFKLNLVCLQNTELKGTENGVCCFFAN